MQALILAGGSGTRFWPASRRRRPKQLLPLLGERSLLRLTFDRLTPLVEPADVWVCTTRELGDAVRRELPELSPAHILLEPAGRNTAPAIGWSVASMPAQQRSEVVVSLHSDHWIEDEDSFRASLQAAVDAAGAPGDALHRVVRFQEKPDAATAAAFLAGGRHLWNAGIFVFPGDLLLDRLRRFEPAIAEAVTAAAADPTRLDVLYPTIPAIPIDTAVMERLDQLSTVVLDCGWSDLGSWEALAAALAGDAAGNETRGRTIAVDAKDNLLWTDDGVVAVLGVEGLAVVQSGRAVLVVPKARSQEVRRIVEELSRRGQGDLL